MKIGSKAAIPFATEIRELAERQGEIKLANLLTTKIRRFYLRQHFSEAFNLLTRNRLKALYHRVVGTRWVQARVTMDATTINKTKPDRRVQQEQSNAA